MINCYKITVSFEDFLRKRKGFQFEIVKKAEIIAKKQGIYYKSFYFVFQKKSKFCCQKYEESGSKQITFSFLILWEIFDALLRRAVIVFFY